MKSENKNDACDFIYFLYTHNVQIMINEKNNSFRGINIENLVGQITSFVHLTWVKLSQLYESYYLLFTVDGKIIII